jgi:segregation and condensation protein A
VKAGDFEGPLDLLLHLIKKNEMDIFDIPIALITEQYLEYLDLMRELDIEIAGDYLVVASELGLIKSRMLLPREESCEGKDEVDPREELVRRLLDYQRYKEASSLLEERVILGRDTFTRLNPLPQGYGEESGGELERMDVWMLAVAVQGILRRKTVSNDKPVQLEMEPLTLEEKIEEINLVLRRRKRLFFEELIIHEPSRFNVVITFLAVLELIRRMIIGVFQELPFSRIELVYFGNERI